MEPSQGQARTRIVEAEDIFFSTTDAKGVIRKANSVFVDIARYSWADLVGAPHNIIRHPDMPGAAFRAMWDTLESGKPFCAYVHNRAADGATYTVLAAVVPLGDGYLSTRVGPQRTDLLELSDAAYATARAAEKQAAEEGLGRPERARRGLPVLAAAVEEATGQDIDTFLRTCLIKEVSARRSGAGAPRPAARRGPAAGDELGELIGEVNGLMTTVSRWAEALDDIDAVVHHAQRAHEAVKGALVESRNTAGTVTSAAGHDAGATPLLNALGLWTRMSAEVDGTVSAVADLLKALARDAEEAAFRLALAHLQVECLQSFVAELAARVEGWQNAVAAIDDLARAVQGCLDAATAALTDLSATSTKAREAMEEAADTMAIPADLLTSWARMAERSGASPAVVELAPVVSSQAGGTRELAAELAGVVSHLQTLTEATASADLDQDCLSRIRRRAEELASQPVQW